MNAVQFACDTSLLYVTKVNIEVRDLNGVRMKTAVREGTISNIYSSVQEVKVDLVESTYISKLDDLQHGCNRAPPQVFVRQIIVGTSS